MLQEKRHCLLALIRFVQPGCLRLAAGLVFLIVIGGCQRSADQSADNSKLPRQQQLAQVRSFFAAKEKQAKLLAAKDGKELLPEFQRYFTLAAKGDWQGVTNAYEALRKRSYHYDNTVPDKRLETMCWQPVNETHWAYGLIADGEPKYVQAMADGVIDSIPAGSIYFGGTDPGRFLITAMSKSHVEGDPFFTLTQNALTDGLYLQYLRAMYEKRIYTPTDEDSQKCFSDYLFDAEKRLAHDQKFPNDPRLIKPGEEVRMVNGKVQVSGQVAIMAINGSLTKVVFDNNPDREFYIEENFPLDWMYPYLEPHGLILKINRQPLPELSNKVIQQDREYWHSRMADMIGDWLTDETPVQKFADFAEKVYLRKDLSGFKGDARFVQSENAQRMFSKLRSSIGGIYVWRMEHATSKEERARMARAADFTFRQTLALCPYSPEAVYRYVQLAMLEKRMPDALLVASTCLKLDPKNNQIKSLVDQLKQQMPKAK
jgi:hypothetical protein